MAGVLFSVSAYDMIDWFLLDAYFANRCTETERILVEQWIAESPDHARVADRVREALSARLRQREGDWNRAAAIEAVFSRLRDTGNGSGKRPKLQERRHSVMRSLQQGPARYAALSVVAAVGIMLAIAFWRPQAPPTQSVRTYATTAGQQATVTFANGVQALLGPETRLSVATDTTANLGTTVTMVGQARFTVPHQNHLPFTVLSTSSMTRVLGTTFYVRQYPAERSARVFVDEGRVSFHGRHQGVAVEPAAVLSQRTLGIVDDSGYMRITPNIAVNDYTGWTKGELVFRKTPVNEIVSELARAYGVKIHLSDSTLTTQTLTWTVAVTKKSVWSAVYALATALDAHVVRSSDTVLTIVSGPSATLRPTSPRTIHSPESQYGR